jgi:predicted nucleic acid-binding protein
MPDKKIVINTSPIISLAAVFGDLSILRCLYDEIIVPVEVYQEILHDGGKHFAADIFREAQFLTKLAAPQQLLPFLKSGLDRGEAAVIQTAFNLDIKTVCIDEVVGRRIARLCGLQLTGSLGIIIRAILSGQDLDLFEAIQKMRNQGIWISEALEKESQRILTEELKKRV